MPKGANVEASWGTDKKIILKAQTGASSDGLVTVRHTLTPSVSLTLGIAVDTGGNPWVASRSASELYELAP